MEEDKGKRPEDEEVLEIVEDGDDQTSKKLETVEDESRQTENKSKSPLDDDDDDDEDVRVGAAEEGGDEEVRRRRREERKRRRRLRQQARDRDRKEIEFLAARNEQLEKRFNEIASRVDRSESMSVEQRVSQIKSAIRNAESVMAEALTKQDGEKHTEAQGIRDSLRDSLRKLEDYQTRMAASSSKPQKEDSDDQESQENRLSGAPSIAPEVVENIRSWHQRNPWYQFDRSDQDSSIVGAIDDMMVREGYDPTESEYFDELDRRIAKHLPHRSSGSDQGGGGAQQRGGDQQRGGPKFRGSSQHGELRPNQVRVTADRKEAMRQAGVWDDPILRQKFLKQYKKWDEENAGTQR